MSLMNSIYATKKITKDEYKIFVTLLNPFAPHITEEIWEMCGFDGMLNQTKWPEYDQAKCVDSSVEIVVQVNGKIRARLNVATDISNSDAIALAKEQEAIIAEISGKTIVKELYVPKKLVNIVVK